MLINPFDDTDAFMYPNMEPGLLLNKTCLLCLSSFSNLILNRKEEKDKVSDGAKQNIPIHLLNSYISRVLLFDDMI